MNTDRKTQVQNQISSFIKADRMSRRSMLTYGVEFEYQLRDTDNCCDCDFDVTHDTEQMYNDAYDEAVENLESFHENHSHTEIIDLIVSVVDPSDFIEEIRNLHFPKRLFKIRKPKLPNCATYRFLAYPSNSPVIKSRMRAIIAKDYDRYVRKSRNSDVDYYLDDYQKIFRRGSYVKSGIITTLQEEVEYNQDPSDYRYDSHDCPDSQVYTAYEHDDDPSVSGGEIRTVGGLDYSEINIAATEILRDIKSSSGAYIDTGCSAHLHVKLGDIKHYYGDGHLHSLVMEFFSFNVHRLPEPVRARLSGGGPRWARPNFRAEKYNWVQFHPQGTIEFRLFGNVSKASDFVQCIDLALDALAYAYRMKRRRNNKTWALTHFLATDRFKLLTDSAENISRKLEAI